MTDKDKDLEIVILDEAQKQIDGDPQLAVAMKDLAAIFRQAHEMVKRGQYRTMDDALEAMTGSRPVKIDPETGEEIVGASFHDDMMKNASSIDIVDIGVKPKPH